MKKSTYILIILLIFFILIMATCASFVYFEFRKPPRVKAHSYLEIKLAGEIQEKFTPDLLSTLFTRSLPLSMNEIWLNFQKAQKDERIEAVVLRLGYLMCNWAKANEIRELILDTRNSGKKVYAYVEESFDFDKEYYIATACDKIVLHPEGILIINGIGGYIPFVKNALDKLGIEFEVEHAGEYKTYYHMFTEDHLTPWHREMLESIYGCLFSHYIQEVAQSRGKNQEEIKYLIDHGFFQGESAKEAGLVDELMYEDEFQEFLRQGKEKINRISHNQYLKIKASSLGLNKGKRIALIYGMGTIYSGEGYSQMMGSTTIASWIRKVRKDKSIAAVVFRVDSPGGSSVASDIIWREVALTKKEKPIVVSMSDLAGSGGYQIAIGANKIVAHPQTLTGSIGVVFAKVNMEELYSKLGITAENVKFGKKADMFSTFRKATPEERKLLQKEITRFYDQFITKVANGRSLPKEEVRKIAKGRVWTGKHAVELGLVDELGGLSKAIDIAKEMAGIPVKDPVKLVVWPKKVSFFEMLTGRRLVSTQFSVTPKVKKALATFQILEHQAPWALMPFWINPE